MTRHPTDDATVILRSPSGRGRAKFDLTDGCRLTQLVLEEHSLLVAKGDRGPMHWGAFIMAPWTSLLPSSEFEADAVRHRLAAGRPDSLWHGVARTASFELRPGGVMAATLGPPWPLGGTVDVAASISDSALELHLTLTAGSRAMPAAVGWHPWFRRDLPGTTSIEVRIPPDAEVLMSTDVGDPADGYDTNFRTPGPIDVVYGGVGVLRTTSDSSFATVYSRSPDGICVEPVTGPAGSLEHVLAARQSLELRLRVEWLDRPSV